MTEPAAAVGSRRASAPPDSLESPYAWTRLFASLLISTIGGVGMWSVVVALPAVQSEFGVARGAASLPYTLTMLCFGVAGIGMGRLSDRYGVMIPVMLGTGLLALGYLAGSLAPSLGVFTFAQGALIGALLVADAVHEP